MATTTETNAAPANGTAPPRKLSLAEKLAQMGVKAPVAEAPITPAPSPSGKAEAELAARKSEGAPLLAPDAPPRDSGKSAGPATVAESSDSPPSPEPEKEAVKKGRPKGSKNQEKPAETPGASRAGFALYVDCIPQKGADKGKGVMLEEWIGPLLKFLAEKHGLEDVRLAPDGSEPAFGRWKALLTLLVRSKAEEVPPVLLISSFALGAHEVLDALIPLAADVVRGIR